MFGFRKKREFSPEISEIFERVCAYVENETDQNQQLPPPVRFAIEAGESVDILPHCDPKTFGRILRNPIPVNGPCGEVIYLSSLTTQEEKHILFHRIGSYKSLDVFETVTFDGRFWDLLFLDMYHPRKSRMAPPGYKLTLPSPLLFGTNARVDEFPGDLANAVMKCTKRLFGLPVRNPHLQFAIDDTDFVRDNDHLGRLSAVARSDFQQARTE